MAKAIMIQGTMSNAGKSLIAAGLCRLFRQDGLRVMPFKSQNMALNSCITREGLEMGRAQAVQAEAAGVEPEAAMNPILLKPVSHMGSQVIVMGEVRGDMSAAEYYANKHTLLPVVRDAYASLAARCDVIVIEGAGSPAEINLREGDFVNMGMAKLAKAPVLLVGDIDRGGVFAQLYGTIALLEEDERALVRALIVNKFRGDVRLLQSGLDRLEALAGRPVAGVVPMLDVDIDDEDSLSVRLTRGRRDAALDIAVIRLPHIANFTDFAALEATPALSLRYVSRAAELGAPDLLILPGTKNTMADLRWLRQCGLEAAVKRLAGGGAPVFGICGGYQMLGESLSDPEGVEGGGGMRGLGLLPIRTVFAAEKRRSRVTARVLEPGGALSRLSGAALEGYEIHMGRTERLSGAEALCRLENGELDGCWQGNVYGSYLHGFFDTAACRDALLYALAGPKGLDPRGAAFDFEAYRQRQYDALAEGLRTHLDMALIYRILEEGV
ncbi:MAG: cobyric acid synthase [Clostridia bacterium]|nr:cobyric acid synthase [Clostridia bacterium]